MAITITDSAAQRIEQALTKRGQGLGIRVRVVTTGCSGMAYRMEYVDEADPDDMVFTDHGVQVYVDPRSAVYMEETTLDYVREGLKEGFKFHNPQERDQCGCGGSFRV
ncbi:HesB/IscA family protein [Candidatus Symbiobacter mobilis]|uniref:Iron-sulfur cluster assembly protein n=1 Tax=Candidatus Symbiobacter mobilis CR TaxID=946483 RepID=U5N9V5_9BURK|nr:iron-sulfur cluster assembly accessory protein [Candidatus Symbiobacter mobilis]AGX87028.1 iron-sulfur cluster assembly protein [Candidatus Symbiobacter mobilis CR]